MHRARIRPALIALAVAAVARTAVAQEPSPAKPDPLLGKPVDASSTGLVTRVFDVRDLTFVAPNYPLGGSLVPPTRLPTAGATAAAASNGGGGSGGGGGGGQTLFTGGNNNGGDQPKPATVSTTGVDGIRRLLMETVDPSSWKDNGGDRGSITATDAGLLFVTQSPAALQRVAAQLDGLRVGRTGMVRVRADWVLLPAGDVGRLFKDGPADTAPLPEIDRHALDALPHAAASLACMSGQTVHLTSGPARTFIATATPVVAPGSVAYDTQQTLVQYGMALQVTPTVGPDTVTLDLTSIASRDPEAPPAATTRPASTDGTATIPSGIDRFAATVQSLQTTAQVPANRPVLIGGMTLDAGQPTPGGAELYLVVEADTAR